MLLAVEALLGEDGVQGVVSALDHGVVDAHLAADLAEHALVHGGAPACQRADLVLEVVALDVDGLDVLSAHLVLLGLGGSQCPRAP